MTDTPMLDKEREAREKGHSQDIGAFLDWLLERYEICTFHSARRIEPEFRTVPGYTPDERGVCANCFEVEGTCQCADKQVLVRDWEDLEAGFYPESKSVQQWLAEYFEIDLSKSEEERRAILEALRSKA